MSKRFVKPVEDHGSLAITGGAIRFDVPMIVDGHDAGSVPVFAEIDKHFSAAEAQTLRRILTDGRRRAIAATFPDVQPLPTAGPDRTLTGEGDLPPRKPAKAKRPKAPRSGLRFLDPEPATPPEAPLPKRKAAKASAKAPPSPKPPVAPESPATSEAPIPKRKAAVKAKVAPPGPKPAEPTTSSKPAAPLPKRKPATRSKR